MFASIYANPKLKPEISTSTSSKAADNKSHTNGHAVYLKGLNGLRAIAVLAVIVTHILQVFSYDIQSGSFGVTIFFTLSGFLITYLLLLEKKKTGTISIVDFYKRRILRIWPLYYLYLIVALLLVYCFFPEKITWPEVFDNTFFLANIAFVKHQDIAVLDHYWSLAVEEQFYLFWPILTLCFLNKYTRFCLCFVLVFFCIRIGVGQLHGTANELYQFFYYLRFDNMAIGGLAAYLYYKNAPVLQVVHHIIFQLIAWAVLLLALINEYHIYRVLDHEIISIITAIIIINQVSNTKTLISLENKVLNYIGGISYGLYIIHPLVIALLILAFGYYHININGTVDIALTVITFIITFCLAHISYKYFESRFLKLKQKFTLIKNEGTQQ